MGLYPAVEDLRVAVGSPLDRDRRQALAAIGGALDLASRILARDVKQMRSQLVGRLSGNNNPEITRFVENAKRTGQMWLRVRTGSLQSPGGPLVRTLPGFASYGGVLGFSADARRLATTADGHVGIWSVDRGRLLAMFACPGPVEMTDDRRTLVFAGQSGIRSIDLETCTEKMVLQSIPKDATSIAVTRDGRKLLSIHRDCNDVLLWDLVEGRQLGSLAGHSRPPGRVAVLHDGRRAVSFSEDETFVWDLDTGSPCGTLGDCAHAKCDGAHLYGRARNGRIEVTDLNTLQPCGSFEGDEVLLALSGSRLLVLEGADVRVLDSTSLKSLAVLRGAEPPQAWVSGGDTLISRSTVSMEPMIVWSMATGLETGRLPGHSGEVRSVVMSPDGLMAASASRDGVRLWNLATEAFRSQTIAHRAQVLSVAVAGAGGIAATSSRDKTIRVWNLLDGRPLQTLSGHSFPASEIALSPSGEYAVSRCEQSMKWWHVGTGRELLTPLDYVNGQRSGEGSGLCFLDGTHDRVAARTQGTVISAHLETGQVTPVVRRREALPALAYSNLGNDSATVQADRWAILTSHRDVSLWDVHESHEACRIPLTGEKVTATGSSSDGRILVVVSERRMLRVWDVIAGSESVVCPAPGNVTALAVNGNGELAALVSDGALVLIDLKSGTPLCQLSTDSDLCCCAFADDCRSIVAGDLSGAVHFVEMVGMSANTETRGVGEPRTPIDLATRIAQCALTVDGDAAAVSRKKRSTLGALNELAVLYEQMGDHEQAAANYARAFETCLQRLGGRHPWTRSVLRNIQKRSTSQSTMAELQAYEYQLQQWEVRFQGAIREEEDAVARSVAAYGPWISNEITRCLCLLREHPSPSNTDRWEMALTWGEEQSIRLDTNIFWSDKLVESVGAWLSTHLACAVGSAAFCLCNVLGGGESAPLALLAVAMSLSDFCNNIIRPDARLTWLMNSLHGMLSVAKAYDPGYIAARLDRTDISRLQLPAIVHLKRERFVVVTQLSEGVAVYTDLLAQREMDTIAFLGLLSGFVLTRRDSIPENVVFDSVQDSTGAFVWG